MQQITEDKILGSFSFCKMEDGRSSFSAKQRLEEADGEN